MKVIYQAIDFPALEILRRHEIHVGTESLRMLVEVFVRIDKMLANKSGSSSGASYDWLQQTNAF
ncbi:MAG TPA: hypothetical protein PKZ32_11705, partial [Candidatus Melainabacteria bacterium]|nr:hypothetical protein [Candidatus Melainabacteria bacterium]